MQKLLVAAAAGKIAVAISRHTLAEILEPLTARVLANSFEIVPYRMKRFSRNCRNSLNPATIFATGERIWTLSTRGRMYLSRPTINSPVPDLLSGYSIDLAFVWLSRMR
jgi:hypothetical protein